MKKKTNRTIHSFGIILLCSTLWAQHVNNSEVISNEQENSSIKGNLIAKLAQWHSRQGHKTFRVFNDIVPFFSLVDEIGNNQKAQEELENLEVKVSSRPVPHGTSRIIPRNDEQTYNVEITMPSGSMPNAIVALSGGGEKSERSEERNRVIAALYKIWEIALEFGKKKVTNLIEASVNFDVYHSGPHNEEYISNFVVGHPVMRKFITDLSLGHYREAFSVCQSVGFRLPLKFKITLPESPKNN